MYDAITCIPFYLMGYLRVAIKTLALTESREGGRGVKEFCRTLQALSMNI